MWPHIMEKLINITTQKVEQQLSNAQQNMIDKKHYDIRN